jgi:hypothetical protein
LLVMEPRKDIGVAAAFSAVSINSMLVRECALGRSFLREGSAAPSAVRVRLRRLPQRLRRLAPLRRALEQQRTMPRVIGLFSRAGTLLRVALIQLN